MSLLSNLVTVLSSYVDDALAIDSAEILQFAQNHDISLRLDHLRFLMKYASPPGKRLAIFKNYGGDFSFEMFCYVYADSPPEIVAPEGHIYFGTDFVGTSFCIEQNSGKIFVCDEELLFGKVHESIDGFLLNCFTQTDLNGAIDSKVVRQGLDLESVNEFRSVNECNKLNEATRFGLGPIKERVLTEFYWVDRKLVELFLPSKTMTTLSGGVLNKLSSE